MPRTTIDIDASVLRELKVRARRDRRSIGQTASELLAGALHSSQPPARRRIEWITRPMGALVDLEDKEAVRRALEER
ncbi:MAG: antitoxin [Candidatus Limnocylindria bacterium]